MRSIEPNAAEASTSGLKAVSPSARRRTYHW